MGLVSFFISIFRRPEERPSPERVFTPRAAEVNPDMYVSRPLLEQKITEALGGTRHFIVHGESGNGKSWLYKKVFKDLGVNYVVVNLANASRLGSLNAALEDKINRSEKGKLIESSSRDTWSVKPGGFGADNAVTNKYQLGNKEPFEWLLQHIRERAGNGPACVVMDNFEQILSDQAIVKQISDCIILLDDEDYSKYGVKLCLVGVPSNIKEYVAGRGHYDTISNRVVELPEVARLTREQAMQLLHRGLEQELKLKVEDPEACYDRIMWRTDRIAQHLHEYGLEVAQIASSAGIVSAT